MIKNKRLEEILASGAKHTVSNLVQVSNSSPSSLVSTDWRRCERVISGKRKEWLQWEMVAQ